MPYRPKTLRNLPPTTRKVARLLNDLESVHTRLRNLMPELQVNEMWAIAQAKREETYGKEVEP